MERYGDRVFCHAVSDEVERLRALAEALDDASFSRLKRLGVGEGWRCLEVGAGLGTTARWLAERCVDGRVVATDLDTRHMAGDRAWEVLEHDVTRDGFPAASFDLIHCRWVLSHLRERSEVLERMVGWLAPGGWLLVEDLAQFPLESARPGLYREVSLAMCAAVSKRIGTDCHWARTFPDPLRACGFVELGVEASVPSVGPGPMGRFWRLSAQQLAGDLERDHGIGASELTQFLDLTESPDCVDLGLATVAAWGRRPAGVGPTSDHDSPREQA